MPDHHLSEDSVTRSAEAFSTGCLQLSQVDRFRIDAHSDTKMSRSWCNTAQFESMTGSHTANPLITWGLRVAQ